MKQRVGFLNDGTIKAYTNESDAKKKVVTPTDKQVKEVVKKGSFYIVKIKDEIGTQKGKPFKTRKSAEAIIFNNKLDNTHRIAVVKDGFVIVRRTTHYNFA